MGGNKLNIMLSGNLKIQLLGITVYDKGRIEHAGGYILGVIERFPKLQLLGYWHHAYIYINGYLNKNVYWSVYNLHICRAHRPSEVENNNTLIQVYVILVHVPTQWISCLRELPL